MWIFKVLIIFRTIIHILFGVHLVRNAYFYEILFYFKKFKKLKMDLKYCLYLELPSPVVLYKNIRESLGEITPALFTDMTTTTTNSTLSDLVVNRAGEVEFTCFCFLGSQ